MSDTSAASVLPPTTSPDSEPYPLYERLYMVFAVTFCTCLVLTNVIGIKLFQAPHDPTNFALTTGLITYPLTFLLTDIVSEIWGQKRADWMVVLGFLMSLLMLAVVQIAVALPPHHYWEIYDAKGLPFYTSTDEFQHAFESVFAIQGLLLFGSMLAYAVAQLTDNRLFHFWKRFTGGKHLWLRNNGSTIVSQLLDSLIVGSILFFIGMKLSWTAGFETIFTIYAYKLLIALLDTPLVYAGVYVVKKALGFEFHEDVVPPSAAGAA